MSWVPESSDDVPLVKIRPSRIPSESDEGTSELSQSEDSTVDVATRQTTRKIGSTPVTSPSEGDSTTAPTPSEEGKTPEPSTSAGGTTPDPSSSSAAEEELKKDEPSPDQESGPLGPTDTTDVRQGARPCAILRPRRQRLQPEDAPEEQVDAVEEDVPRPPPEEGGPPQRYGMYRYVPGASGLEAILNLGADDIGSSNCSQYLACIYLLCCIIIAAIVVLAIMLITHLYSASDEGGSGGNVTDSA